MEPLSLSPSRVIKILFNQVSKENPFAPPLQDFEENVNSADGSEESIGRYRELLDSHILDKSTMDAMVGDNPSATQLAQAHQTQQHPVSITTILNKDNTDPSG